MKSTHLQSLTTGRLGVRLRLLGGLLSTLSCPVLLGSCEEGSPVSDSASWQGISPSKDSVLPPPVDVLSPAAYVSKVKNLLTGEQVVVDPDTWLPN